MKVITCAFGAPTVRTSTVAVRIPGDERHWALLRGLTDTVSLVADLPLGAAAEIRLAVSEIATMLVARSVPGSTLGCAFTYSTYRMSVRVEAVAAFDEELGGDPLNWELVRMLASSLSISRHPFDPDVRGYPTVIEFKWERGPFDT
ncbi:anti-sigma factor [Nocardia sp. R6R-6]|uniref:anti-sigma factor n=1 Tax=Nocardia sp. R6R-6 TaxID=3459303 RepID=UPI00403DD2A2